MTEERECCPTCGRTLYQVHRDRKLTDEQAAEIILNPKNKTNRQFAKEFNVDVSLVSNIRNGKRYIDVYSRLVQDEEVRDG